MAQKSGGSAKRRGPGRPFKPGESGNPGGRPKGLEKYARELVGDDGHKCADLWLEVMEDTEQDVKVRLEASKLLAERAFGRPAQLFEIGTDEGPLQVVWSFDPRPKKK